jgi:hypothetical protein
MTTTPTKRKYAHELYPVNPSEFEVRRLAIEVPALYAQAIGWSVWGTGWFDLMPRPFDKNNQDHLNAANVTMQRTQLLIAARQRALHADAIYQGLTGQEAWEWAESRMDEEGGWVYDRAVHYGIDVAAIKPYPCGPEPDHHRHYSEPDARGFQTGTRIAVPESECVDCCEPVDPRTPTEADVALPIGVPA